MDTRIAVQDSLPGIGELVICYRENTVYEDASLVASPDGTIISWAQDGFRLFGITHWKRRNAACTAQLEPDYAVPPGATLQETIDNLGIDQRELEKRTGLSAEHINQIIQGVAPISHEVAILLECVTRVPARLWNNLESNYQKRLARLVAHE